MNIVTAGLILVMDVDMEVPNILRHVVGALEIGDQVVFQVS